MTVEGVEDSANNDTQDCERFLLSFTGLTEKQWGSQSQNRSYFVQANCAFVPDVFTSTTSTTLNSSSSSGFEFEPAAKKRRVSSKAAANDAFINYDPASWIELGSIIHECQTEATTPSFSKEYTIADLQRNVAQEIFNLRLFHYLQQQQKYLSARRAHDRDDQVQEWPPASKLYFKFRVKAMDEDGTSDFVFADSEIDDDSLLKAAEVAAANKEEEEKREKIDTAIEDAMPDEQKSPLLAEGEACAESDDIVMGDAHDAASAEAAAVNDNVIVPYSPSSQGATDTVMEMDSASVVVEPPPPTTTATSLSTMAVAVSSIDSPNLVEEKEASVVEVGANISEALTANTAPLRVAPHHKSKKPRGSLRASPKKSLSTPTQKRWPNSASFSDENSDLSNHEDDEYDNEIPVASPVVTAAVAPKASTSSTTNTTTTIASSTSANTHDPRVIFANEWFLKLGFGDVFEIKSDGEFYGAKAINYIYYKRINRIYLHFWYLNFNEKDQGRDW